jgi:aspartyl-tRNA(Asn)/glutamyl-tRNA(Gln) amidotransferase subunit C
MSSKITNQVVKKIGYLARLSNDPDEQILNKYTEELDKILNYVEELNEVDVSGVDPLEGVRTIKLNELREDEPVADSEEYAKVRANIIRNFPQSQGNLLIVPGVLV